MLKQTGPYPFCLKHGAHRLYCSLAAGYTHIPAVKFFDLVESYDLEELCRTPKRSLSNEHYTPSGTSSGTLTSYLAILRFIAARATAGYRMMFYMSELLESKLDMDAG